MVQASSTKILDLKIDTVAVCTFNTNKKIKKEELVLH